MDNISQFLNKTSIIYDVRSPLEFKQGSIPFAVNMPLFSNEERARVGTLYKQQGNNSALKLGLKFVGPKLADFISQIEAISEPIHIYCARGGMRSQSMCWLLQLAGKHVHVLAGGYKQFRRFILNIFEQKFSFIVLGGMTGSGKTQALHDLAKRGEQVLDLEHLAKHRGSAFGMLGMESTPTTEQFENLIGSALANMDTSRPIWVEDESRFIGQCKIPDAIYHQCSLAPQIHIQKSLQERMQHLLDEYGKAPTESLTAATRKLSKRLGSERTDEIIQAIEKHDLKTAITYLLSYYDKAYTYANRNRLKPLATVCSSEEIYDQAQNIFK